MTKVNKRASSLNSVPGVGKAVSRDLERLGIHTASDLKGKDPEKLYQKLCAMDGPTDRCMLYTFRCAVYFASRSHHDPEKLKWWNWKD